MRATNLLICGRRADVNDFVWPLSLGREQIQVNDRATALIECARFPTLAYESCEFTLPLVTRIYVTSDQAGSARRRGCLERRRETS